MRLQANVLEVYTTISREGRAMCVKQHTQSQSRRKYSIVRLDRRRLLVPRSAVPPWPPERLVRRKV